MGNRSSPPTVPTAGPSNGPGPLIPLAPSSQLTLVGDGTSVVELGLDADLHTLKFGPYFELPVSSRWVVGLSFGYCTVLPDAQFQISESTRFPGTDIPGSSLERTVRRSDWQPGGYAEIRVNFELTRNIGLYLAGEFNTTKISSSAGLAGKPTSSWGRSTSLSRCPVGL